MQPAHLRARDGRLHEQRLLDVAVDDGVMVIGAEVKRRPRDRSRSPIAASRAVSRSAGTSSSPSTSTLGGADPAEVGLGRVEARLQQPQDLLAGEQFGAHPLGLELGAQRVDVREVLAHRAAVREHRALQAAPTKPASRARLTRPRQRGGAVLWRGVHGTTT